MSKWISMVIRLVVVSGCALAVALARGSSALPLHRGVSFSHEPCWFELPKDQPADRIECGRLTVPEDWTVKEGRSVSIAVAVLKSAGKRSHRALVYLDGGPGGETLERGFRRWTPE